MTKEEAKDKVINYALGQKTNDGINTMEELVDKIFDEYEAGLRDLHAQYADAIIGKKELVDNVFKLTEQLKAKDKRIVELEEAMKPKTCEGCIYAQVRHYSHGTVWLKDTASVRCDKCSRTHDDNFEPKDNA